MLIKCKKNNDVKMQNNKQKSGKKKKNITKYIKMQKTCKKWKKNAKMLKT